MTPVLYLEIDFICMAILAVVIAKLMPYFAKPQSKKRILLFWACFLMLTLVLDVVGYGLSTLESKAAAVFLRGIDFFYFASFTFSTFLSFIYAQLINDKYYLNSTKKVCLTAVPFAAISVLLFISCFNGCIFEIDDCSNYARGSLYFLVPLVSYGYFAAAAGFSVFQAQRNIRLAVKKELFSYAISCGIIVLAGLLQSIVNGLPLILAVVSIVVLINYVLSLEVTASLDPLTGIPNRREFNQHLVHVIKALKPEQKLYVMFADVDSFKEINDTYGHGEGDRILKLLAKVMREYCADKLAYCARFGGDELVLAICLEERQSIEEVCRDLEELIVAADFNAGVSIGYALYRGEGDSPQNLILRADKAMYRVKTAKKEAAL